MAAPGLPAARLAELLEDYGAAQQRFEALGGYAWASQAAAVRAGLGLAGRPDDLPVARLSGGQKTWLGLARLLLASPRLLLIDEPTNHLDDAAVAWLEEYLGGFAGAALIVSHDRAFLDRAATRILELRRCDPAARPQARSYAGSYGDYAEARAAERERQRAQWRDQQDYVAEVADNIERLKRFAQVAPHSIGARKLGRAAKARERKLERYVESDERVAEPRQSWGVRLDLGAAGDGARVVLRVEDVCFGYEAASGQQSAAGGREAGHSELRTADCQLPSGELLKEVSFDQRYGERVALVGPNGAGRGGAVGEGIALPYSPSPNT